MNFQNAKMPTIEILEANPQYHAQLYRAKVDSLFGIWEISSYVDTTVLDSLEMLIFQQGFRNRAMRESVRIHRLEISAWRPERLNALLLTERAQRAMTQQGEHASARNEDQLQEGPQSSRPGENKDDAGSATC